MITVEAYSRNIFVMVLMEEPFKYHTFYFINRITPLAYTGRFGNHIFVSKGYKDIDTNRKRHLSWLLQKFTGKGLIDFKKDMTVVTTTESLQDFIKKVCHAVGGRYVIDKLLA